MSIQFLVADHDGLPNAISHGWVAPEITVGSPDGGVVGRGDPRRCGPVSVHDPQVAHNGIRRPAANVISRGGVQPSRGRHGRDYAPMITSTGMGEAMDQRTTRFGEAATRGRRPGLRRSRDRFGRADVGIGRHQLGREASVRLDHALPSRGHAADGDGRTAQHSTWRQRDLPAHRSVDERHCTSVDAIGVAVNVAAVSPPRTRSARCSRRTRVEADCRRT